MQSVQIPHLDSANNAPGHGPRTGPHATGPYKLNHTNSILTTLRAPISLTTEGLFDSIAILYADFIQKQTTTTLTIKISPTFQQRINTEGPGPKVAIDTVYEHDREYDPPAHIRHKMLVDVVQARMDLSAVLNDEGVRRVDEAVRKAEVEGPVLS